MNSKSCLQLCFCQGTPLSLLCSPNTSKILNLSISQSNLNQIVQIFYHVFIVLILRFLSFQNILFLEGTGAIPRKSPKPLKTSKCMRIRQYCTIPLTSICIVFIKTSWTFLSLQNICSRKGTAYLNLMRDLLLLLPRNIIETAPLMGTKGSMISQLLHQFYFFWTHESGIQQRVSGQQKFPKRISFILKRPL